MVAPIRQTIKIEQDGRIEIRSPQLHSGATAEVIVLVRSGNSSPHISMLDNLQGSMRLDHLSAQAWASRARDERFSNSRFPGMKAG